MLHAVSAKAIAAANKASIGFLPIFFSVPVSMAGPSDLSADGFFDGFFDTPKQLSTRKK